MERGEARSAIHFWHYYNKLDRNNEGILSFVRSKIRDPLLSKAASLGERVYELSSTLLFVAVNDNDFLVLHIGDKIIGAINNNKSEVGLLYPRVKVYYEDNKKFPETIRELKNFEYESKSKPV